MLRGSTVFQAMLAETHAAGGRGDEAWNTVVQLQECAKLQYVTLYMIGRVYAALGMDAADSTQAKATLRHFSQPQRINPARRRRSAVGAVIVTRVASVESISCDLVTVSIV